MVIANLLTQLSTGKVKTKKEILIVPCLVSLTMFNDTSFD